MSTLAFKITKSLIPKFSESFTKAHLVGVDVAKRNRPVIPEAMGVVAGCVFLIFMYLCIPIPFLDSWEVTRKALDLPHGQFDHKQVTCFYPFATLLCPHSLKHSFSLPYVYSLSFLASSLTMPHPFFAVCSHVGSFAFHMLHDLSRFRRRCPGPSMETQVTSANDSLHSFAHCVHGSI